METTTLRFKEYSQAPWTCIHPFIRISQYEIGAIKSQITSKQPCTWVRECEKEAGRVTTPQLLCTHHGQLVCSSDVEGK